MAGHRPSSEEWRPSSQRFVDLGCAALQDGEQAAGGVLREVGRRAMGVEGGLIVVLLEKKNPPRVDRRTVGLVHAATRLGAGGRGQLAEQLHRLGLAARL